MIHHGDCLDVMAAMDPESVDAVVTDPPYGLMFMGKSWDTFGGPLGVGHGKQRGQIGREVGGAMKAGDSYDRSLKGNRGYQEWCEQWGAAALRVTKPGGWLLSSGGTRTVHRLAAGLEDAGWIIRDMLVWGYASGFPKSKASLKPAWEPIVMARKPGPLRMLAIDECRIGTTDDLNGGAYAVNGTVRDDGYGMQRTGGAGEYVQPLGRWPANIVLTDPIFDGGIEGVVGGGEANGATSFSRPREYSGSSYVVGDAPLQDGYGDTGTYSRFFLIPKAARSDREPVLGGLPLTEYAAGSAMKRCAVCGKQEVNVHGSECQCAEPQWIRPEAARQRANHHPTVKPVDLMRHLVRLVTPTGGTVLDPFLGSGTTALAAEMEGFAWIGIEREAEYVAIAEARLNGTQKGMAL